MILWFPVFGSWMNSFSLVSHFSFRIICMWSFKHCILPAWKTISLLQRAFSVPSVESSNNLFISDAWLEPKVTPLTVFKQDPSSGQLARLGWPAEQHVLLLAQQQVRQSWDTAEGEGTQEIRDGWWSPRNPEGRHSEHADCRERAGTEARNKVLVLGWHRHMGIITHSPNTLCAPLSSGWGCKAMLQTKAESI